MLETELKSGRGLFTCKSNLDGGAPWQFSTGYPKNTILPAYEEKSERVMGCTGKIVTVRRASLVAVLPVNVALQHDLTFGGSNV